MILIVEACQLSRDVIHQNLIESGFDVLVAASGLAAITTLENRHADLCALITDLHIDNINGWNIAKRARGLNQDIAVIYMSGSAGDGWGTERVPRSMLLSKPFTNMELLAALSYLSVNLDSRCAGQPKAHFYRPDAAAP